MNRAYLLTGTNMGDRELQLTRAKSLIEEQIGHVTNTSGIYETAAWGKTDQDAFLNQALEIETSLNAKQVIRRILKIEKQMGRERKEKYGPRLIDIDILLFNNDVYHYPFLHVPHPEMHNRRFALIPLSEIAPDLMHPVLHQTISELIAACNDKGEVFKKNNT